MKYHKKFTAALLVCSAIITGALVKDSVAAVISLNTAPDGGVINTATDKVLTIRSNGATPVQTLLGSAAASSASAFTASNLAVTGGLTGNLPNPSLAAPSPSARGGVFSAATSTSMFLTGISTSGTPTMAQPAFSDISGVATVAQGGTGTNTAQGTGAVVLSNSPTITGLTATGTTTLGGITGSSQCLQVNSSGVVSGSGSACGGGGGGSVSVTAGSADILINPTPGTGTFTVGTTSVINALGTATATTVQASDMAKLLTHSRTATGTSTLPQAGTTGFGSGVAYTELNLGTGYTDIVASGTSTINGAASVRLYNGGWRFLNSNGSNWFAVGNPGYGTITSNALPKFIDGSGALTASTITDTAGTATVGGNLTVTGTATISSITGLTQCLQVDSAGAISGTGSACGGGGGGGGVNSGTSGQLAYYAANGATVSGNPFVTATNSAFTSTLPTVVATNTAASFTVGAAGLTNPAFQVSSVAGSVSGIKVTATDTGNATVIETTDSGSSAPLTIRTKSGNMILNAAGANTLRLQRNTSDQIALSGSTIDFTTTISTTASNIHYSFTMPSSETGLTASVERTNFLFGRPTQGTVQHTAGALALERHAFFRPNTLSFTGASVATDVANIGYELANAGTNATIVNNSGILHQQTALTGTITNSYGLNIEADTGATNNYAARLSKGASLIDGVISTGTKFTASGCSNSNTIGGAAAGRFTVGSTGACSVTITMAGAQGMAAPNGWNCSANNLTAPASLITQSASATGTATLQGTVTTGDVISFSCMGY